MSLTSLLGMTAKSTARLAVSMLQSSYLSAGLRRRCISCGKELPSKPGDLLEPDSISHGSCDRCTDQEMAKLDAASAQTLLQFWALYLRTVPNPQDANVEELLERAVGDEEAGLVYTDLVESRGLSYVKALAEQALSSIRKGSTMTKARRVVPKLFVAPAAVVAEVFGLSASKGTVGFSYENKHWVLSYNGQRSQSPLRTAEVYAIYHDAIQRKELDTALELTEEQIEGLPEAQFYDLTSVVVKELETLGQKARDLEEVFKRLRAGRLLRLLSAYKGKVVQIREAVLQLQEGKPSTPYKEILDALVRVHPELDSLVQELTTAQLMGKPPVQSIKKYLLSSEPSTWKKLQHETVGALLETSVDVRALEQLLRSHLERLDTIMQELAPLQLELAACTRGAALEEAALDPAEQSTLLQKAVALLQQVDFGQDPSRGIPLLEQARKLIQDAGVQPVDVELAIRTWADNPTQAQGFIHGPSNRGSGKGALADLLALVEKLKQGAK